MVKTEVYSLASLLQTIYMYPGLHRLVDATANQFGQVATAYQVIKHARDIHG